MVISDSQTGQRLFESVLPEDFTDAPETEEQAAQEEDEAAQAEALQNQTAETDNPEKPAGEEPAENN